MSRTTIVAGLALLGMLHVASAFAGCESPVEPASFPDPATASGPEMVSAQQNVKQYLSGMEARLKCLEAARDTDRYNDSISQMQKVASKFNAVVRAYKARQSG